MPALDAPVLTLQVPPVPRGRLAVLDELKGIAIILVVLYHAGGVLQWNNYLHGDLGVDFFVILSGLGLAMGTPFAGFGPFFRRRLLRIIPTYWIALTAFLLLNTHFLQHRYSVANVVVHYLGIHGWCGDSYAMAINDSFWFITLILTLYAVYAFAQRLLQRPDHLLLCGAIVSLTAALAFFLTGQAGSFGHIGLRLPGFFYGLLLGRLLLTGRLDLALGPVLLLAALLLTYVPYSRGIVFHTGIVALVAMAFYALVVHPRLRGITGEKVRGILRFLGDHSLEIFLLHQPLLRDYNLYLHGRWFNDATPSAPSLIMGMLAGLTLTLLLSFELRRTLQRILPK